MSDTQAPAASLLTFPNRAEDRLRLALHRLDAALAAQREAVAAWRAELGRLGTAVRGLDGSVTELQRGFDSTAEALRRADQETQQLDRTADAMLAIAMRQGAAAGEAAAAPPPA